MIRRVLPALGALGVIGVAGCDGGGKGTGLVPDGPSDEADADTDADSDADADTDTDTDTEPPPPIALGLPAGVFVLPNVDWPDNWLAGLATDDEIAPFAIVPGEETVAITLALATTPGQPARVWRDGAILLDADHPRAELPFEDPAAPVALGVEMGAFGGRATVSVEVSRADSDEPETHEIPIFGAPLLVNHHLEEAERVVMTEVSGFWGDNAAMVDAFADALGSRFETADGQRYGSDVWIQDEIELATCSVPGDRLDVVIDSIRDRGLDDYPEDVLRGDDFASVQFSRVRANSYDSFGNLETVPPIPGFPAGMTYFGDVGRDGPNDLRLHEILDAQQIQGGLRTDTSWLCVGHVDEFMSTIPDPTAPRGFRLIWSDADEAWDVLDAMDPDTRLPRWAGARNHGYDTVGELVSDQGVRALNADLTRDRLDPILDQLRAEWALTEDEIVRIPGLFEEPAGCGGRVAALIPGMANLVVANFPGEPVRVFTADPFVREDLADQADDPVIQRFRDVFPPAIELHFVDDWETYHLALGEVHCGTNVIRTPSHAWWAELPGGAP